MGIFECSLFLSHWFLFYCLYFVTTSRRRFGWKSFIFLFKSCHEWLFHGGSINFTLLKGYCIFNYSLCASAKPRKGDQKYFIGNAVCAFGFAFFLWTQKWNLLGVFCCLSYVDGTPSWAWALFVHKMFDSLIMVFLYMSSFHACASKTTKELSSCVWVFVFRWVDLGPYQCSRSVILFKDTAEGLWKNQIIVDNSKWVDVTRATKHPKEGALNLFLMHHVYCCHEFWCFHHWVIHKC